MVLRVRVGMGIRSLNVNDRVVYLILVFSCFSD